MPKKGSPKPRKSSARKNPRKDALPRSRPRRTDDSILDQDVSTAISNIRVGRTRTTARGSSKKKAGTTSQSITLTPWEVSFEEDLDPKRFFGFLYIVYNKKTKQKYVGRKQFKRYSKKKAVGYTDWKTYKGSSKYLHQAIKDYGLTNFRFVIIHQYETRGGLTYAEANAQHKLDVLTNKLDSQEEREYYNRQIGGIKFIPKEVCHDLNEKLEKIIEDF